MMNWEWSQLSGPRTQEPENSSQTPLGLRVLGELNGNRYHPDVYSRGVKDGRGGSLLFPRTVSHDSTAMQEHILLTMV